MNEYRIQELIDARAANARLRDENDRLRTHLSAAVAILQMFDAHLSEARARLKALAGEEGDR